MMAGKDAGAEVRYHELAGIFPLLFDDELDELAADIREYGLRDEIVLAPDGSVLDGRNRLMACRMAAVEPRFRKYDGPADSDSLLAYVLSQNLVRRHLSSDQRAMAAAKAGPLVERLKAEAAERKKQAGKEHGRGQNSSFKDLKNLSNPNDNLVDQKLAESFGTNRTYVAQARKLQEVAPEIAKKVEAGEVKLSQAVRDVQRQERRKQLDQKATEAKATNGGKASWKVIHGDCIEQLKAISGARLIFADPPYNIGIDYGPGAKADKLPEGEYLAWCQKWISQCVNALTDDGSLWVMIGDEYADHFGLMLSDAGMHRRAWIKWYETFGVNCSNNFNRTSRHIFYCVCDRKRFVFNADAVNRPSDRQTKYGDKRADPSGKVWDDVWEIPRLVGTAAERIPDFPTQLPLELTRAIVGCASDPGDLVVDPFSGSASTGVAAVELGRRYVGIEREKAFCDLSRKRLAGA